METEAGMKGTFPLDGDVDVNGVLVAVDVDGGCLKRG